jgi:apolipoprotein N-acyltransferase
LSPRSSAALAVTAVGAFHLGFLFAPLSWLVLVWLGCLFALRRTACGRGAFYTGLAIGLGIYGPQLHFFWNIFGPAAIALWLILAFWLALFVLLLHGVDKYGGAGWAVALAPVLWLGLEFFRSELYHLRFAWFTAGSVLPTVVSGPLLPWLGVYGLGAWLVFLAGVGVRALEERGWHRHGGGRLATRLAGVSLAVGVLLTVFWPATRKADRGPVGGMPVAGIQLEFPKPTEVLDALNRAEVAELGDSPAKPQLYLLSEYTFDGPVPDEVLQWCREKRRWLVAGGKEFIEGNRFYNTAFVIGTNGSVAFKQAKAVPIQFFTDGVPAPEQRVWESPWGKLGLCICYDLSYTRVVDRLIRQGARALIVPAMDTVDWGEHQHRLNARMTVIRSAEHLVPILRVASSGFSQLTSDNFGGLVRETSFPGQGEIITGKLAWRGQQSPSIPFDRPLAPVAVAATAVITIWLVVRQRRVRRPPPPSCQLLTSNS